MHVPAFFITSQNRYRTKWGTLNYYPDMDTARGSYEMGTFSAAHEEVTRLRRHDLSMCPQLAPEAGLMNVRHLRYSLHPTVARMLTWHEVDNRRMRR